MLGSGVIVISLAYGTRSLLVGLVMLSTGYAAVGLPRWYLTRLPHHRTPLHRTMARLHEMGL